MNPTSNLDGAVIVGEALAPWNGNTSVQRPSTGAAILQLGTGIYGGSSGSGSFQIAPGRGLRIPGRWQHQQPQ